MCLTILSLVLTYLYSTDTFFMVCFLLVTLCVHRQYPHQVTFYDCLRPQLTSHLQVTVSEASLRRNNLEYVSAATRADPEGFIPPSRDWTRSPATSTSPPAPLSPSPSLPLPQIVRDSSSRLAIGFPKRRNGGDTEPIVDNVDNAETWPLLMSKQNQIFDMQQQSSLFSSFVNKYMFQYSEKYIPICTSVAVFFSSVLIRVLLYHSVSVCSGKDEC